MAEPVSNEPTGSNDPTISNEPTGSNYRNSELSARSAGFVGSNLGASTISVMSQPVQMAQPVCAISAFSAIDQHVSSFWQSNGATISGIFTQPVHEFDPTSVFN